MRKGSGKRFKQWWRGSLFAVMVLILAWPGMVFSQNQPGNPASPEKKASSQPAPSSSNSTPSPAPPPSSPQKVPAAKQGSDAKKPPASKSSAPSKSAPKSNKSQGKANESAAQKSPPEAAEKKSSVATGPDQPLPPDKYFQLVLERQELEIATLKQMSKILDEYKGDTKATLAALARVEEERQIKVLELFNKYGITPESYYRSYRGTEVQAERARYLDAHPEIRDKIAANSRTIRQLEEEVNTKLNKIVPSPRPLPKSQKKK